MSSFRDNRQNLGTIQNFLNFLDIKTREGKDMRLSENADIHKNVSFAYPNTETNAVDNVSFTIKNRKQLLLS